MATAWIDAIDYDHHSIKHVMTHLSIDLHDSSEDKSRKIGEGTRFSTQWQSLSALLKMMNTWMELVVHAPMPSSPLSFLIPSSHDPAHQRIKISKGPCSAADAMVRQQGMALAKEDPRDSKTGCKISGGNTPLEVFDAMAGKKHGKQVAFEKVGKN